MPECSRPQFMSNRLSVLWPLTPQHLSPPCEETGVVLIHGITGTPTEMRPLARYLQRLGYRVEIPLLAGHGEGYREILVSTWSDWLASVREAVQRMAATCPQVVVVGLSAGGLLGLLMAAEGPQVSGLAMLSVHFGIPGSRISRTDYFLFRLLSALPRLRRHWYFVERPPYGLKDARLQQRITAAIRASKRGQTDRYGLFRTYAETMHQVYQLEDAARRMAPRVRCPTLLIHSFEDTMLSVHNATTVYRLLGSSEKTVVLLTGCDHLMTVDLQKEAVAERVGSFVHRIAARSHGWQGASNGH